MADDSHESISEAEVAALDEAHGLLKKSARILTPVAAHMNEVWPGSNWPRDIERATRQISLRFRRWPSYSVQHQTGYRCGLSIGIFCEDEIGWLGVWVWALSKRVAERSRILELASKLPPGWDHNPSSSEMLGAYRRLSDCTNSGDASDWLNARVDELAVIGMFTLIEGFGREPADDVEAD